MSNYEHQPSSPLHPRSDEECELPSCKISNEAVDFLDLNPDLSANGDDGDDGEVEPKDGEITTMYVEGDRKEDFEPLITPVDSPLPTRSSDSRIGVLDSLQQSKFKNYVDEQLMTIQRKFVQSFGLNDIGYKNLDELLKDLEKLISFIWLSIDPKTVSSSSETAKSTLFGQQEYLITISNDLLDYVEKLEISNESASNLLKLLSNLDSKFAKLIDGAIPGGKPIYKTQAVRISAIAQRSRLVVMDQFDKSGITMFRYELSTLYEKTLERTT